MNSGWIKIHRKMAEHWVMDDPMHAAGWLAVIMNVNWKPSKKMIKGTMYELKAGQSCRSIAGWADVLPGNWTRQSVRTFFSHLEKDKMINQHGNKKTTILTVCNYDTYQTDQPTPNQRLTTQQPTPNHSATIDEEGKKVRMEEGKNEHAQEPDESDPFDGQPRLAPLKPVTPQSGSESEWHAGVSSQAWVTDLRRAGVKIGPKNWEQCQGVLERAFRGDSKAMAAFSLKLAANTRWPDNIEQEYRKRHPSEASGREVMIL